MKRALWLAALILGASVVSCTYNEEVVSISSLSGMKAEISNRGPKLLSLSVPANDGSVKEVLFDWQNPKDTLEPAVCKIIENGGNFVTFRLPDTRINVTYRLTRTGKFELEYEGTASRKTDLELKDAIYINLAGMPQDSTQTCYDVMNDHLWLNAAEAPFFHCRLVMGKYFAWMENIWKLNTDGDTGRVASCQTCAESGLEMKLFTTESHVFVHSVTDATGSGLALTPCDSTGVHRIALEKGEQYSSRSTCLFYTFDPTQDRVL